MASPNGYYEHRNRTWDDGRMVCEKVGQETRATMQAAMCRDGRKLALLSEGKTKRGCCAHLVMATKRRRIQW